MSCQHGNHVDACEECQEIDAAYDRAFSNGVASREAEVSELRQQLAAMEGQRDRAIDTCAARENEIIKIENKLGEAHISFLAIKTSLQLTNDSQEGSITDTLWMIGGTETVFDRLDKALATTEPKL